MVLDRAPSPRPPRPAPPEEHAPRATPTFRRTDLLLPAALILWVVACKSVNPDAIDDWGLFPALPVIFFVALGLLVASIVVVLTQDTLSPLRLTVHLVALVVVLHGTVPLIFSAPNYPWAYKHMGVTRYIGGHGRIDPAVDIYHSWPGFFALTAWLGNIAGVENPMAYAAWAPVYFNLVTCLLLSFAFRFMHMSKKVQYLALFLFVPANWVGQDYFAPQALAFVLSVAVLAMVLAWLQVDRPIALVRAARRLVSARVVDPRRAIVDVVHPAALSRRTRMAALAAIIATFTVVVVSHQLSPYMVIVGLGAVTFAGFVRPRWLIVLLTGITAAYLLPRFGYLESTHSLLDSLFNPVKNLGGNDFGNTRGLPGRQLALGAPALVVGMWGLGVLGVALRLRMGRPTLVPALLAASPVLIAVAQSYGGEAIFRIYLFSLPWTAVLAASALEPPIGRWRLEAQVKIGVVLSVVVVLFMTAFFGSIELYRVRPGEIQASQYFYDHAEQGSVLVLATSRFPGRVAANYDQFVSSDSTPNLLAPENGLRRRMLGTDDLPDINRFVQQYVEPGGGRVYLVLTSDQQVYAEVLGLVPRGSLTGLTHALDQAPEWEEFYRNEDAVIYRLVEPGVPAPAAAAASPAARAPAPREEPGAEVVALAIGLVGAGLLIGLAYRRRRTMSVNVSHFPGGWTKEETVKAKAMIEEVSPHATAASPTPVAVGELLRRAVVTAGEGRQASVAALTQVGIEPAEVAELVAGMDPGYRAEAVRVLRKASGPLSSYHLEPLLRDPSGSLRAAALEVMEVRESDVGWLHELLRDDLSAGVRVAAARALAQAPESDRLAALATALYDPDSTVRLTATEMLAVANVSAARPLLLASEDPDPAVRRAAQRHLVRTPSWVLWMVLGQSSQADELLSFLKNEAPDCLLALVLERMSSLEPKDRARAIRVAGHLSAPALTRTIEDAVSDTEAEVRRAAVAQLSGRLEAVPTLVRALGDEDREVRLIGAQALDGIEHDDAVAALIDLLQDPDDHVRRTAVDVLARRSSAGLARRLAKAVTAANRDAVTEVLRRLGPVGQTALDSLGQDDAAQDHSADLSLLHALEEVARIRREAAVEAELTRAALLEEARAEADRMRREASAEIEQLWAEAGRHLGAPERSGDAEVEHPANGVSMNNGSALSEAWPRS